MHAVIDPVRRKLLEEGAAMVCALIAGTALTHAETAQAKSAKSQMQYQTHPHDGRSCATCRFFTAAADDKGSCQLVEGEISREGWCVAYAARESP